jgi:hypothetical protein
MNLGKLNYNFIFCPSSYFFKLANFHLSQFPFIYLTFSWIQFCWIPSFPTSLGLSIARVPLIHYFWKKSKSKFLFFMYLSFPWCIHWPTYSSSSVLHSLEFIEGSIEWNLILCVQMSNFLRFINHSTFQKFNFKHNYNLIIKSNTCKFSFWKRKLLGIINELAQTYFLLCSRDWVAFNLVTFNKNFKCFIRSFNKS